MFARHFIRWNRDGSAPVYLYLARNYLSHGKERQKLVAKPGRLDVLQAGGALDRLIASLSRYSEWCWVGTELPGAANNALRAAGGAPTPTRAAS